MNIVDEITKISFLNALIMFIFQKIYLQSEIHYKIRKQGYHRGTLFYLASSLIGLRKADCHKLKNKKEGFAIWKREKIYDFNIISI